MEQGAVNGFNVLDKANSTLDVGKFAESFPCKITMGHPYHEENPHRPLSAGDDDDPTSNHRKGANKMPCSNEQHIVYADAILHPPSATTGARTLQPFHISPGGMAAALEFPFTWAQWKELERQAMIYKYMVSAIPVPQDLLLQICTNSSGASQLASGSVQGRRHTNIRDLEPGRCKRTDGKKWRCSRDVAPHQKYCERHMHRGRPRSRKHVEVHANNNSNDSNNKKTRIRPESTPPMAAVPKPPPPAGQTAKSSTQHHRSTFQQMEGPLFFHDKMGQNISCNESHSSGWMMGSELVENADAGKRWQLLMDSNTDFSADVKFHPNLHHGSREEALNLMTCRDSEGSDDVSIRHNAEFYFMINPELVEQSVKETPRNMFNAWSTDNVYNNNGNMEEASLWPSRGDISPSSLTLSMAMAAGDALDEDMGLESSVMSTAYQHKSWENNWFPFASGGPLAEVLHPNSSIQGENPASSYTSNGDSTSPAATTVSSPSGVLQKTMFSHSDGSVCSSPIPAPPTNTTSENVPFQWLR